METLYINAKEKSVFIARRFSMCWEGGRPRDQVCDGSMRTANETSASWKPGRVPADSLKWIWWCCVTVGTALLRKPSQTQNGKALKNHTHLPSPVACSGMLPTYVEIRFWSLTAREAVLFKPTSRSDIPALVVVLPPPASFFQNTLSSFPSKL